MANTYTTHRRQLYMLPTKAGWVFSLMVFLLFLASIKFSHQATFLLTFLMCGFGMISSFHTQKNINQLRLQFKNGAPVFESDTVKFTCTLSNTSNTKRHNIWLMCGDYQTRVDIDANSEKTVIIKVPANSRGIHRIAPVSITSHFPIGILFGWSRAFQADACAIVYPKPIDILAPPSASFVSSDEGDSQEMHGGQQQGGEQIAALKAYQAGDRLRDIHWPSLAKSGQLVSKEYDNNAEHKRVFNWQQVQSIDLEDKLSQLTFWLLAADKQNMDYQLSIPGFESSYAHGEHHLTQCLEKLALWEINSGK